MDFAIDAGLADAAGDELRHLRAEVDDQHLVVAFDDFAMGVGGGKRGHQEPLNQKSGLGDEGRPRNAERPFPNGFIRLFERSA